MSSYVSFIWSVSALTIRMPIYLQGKSTLVTNQVLKTTFIVALLNVWAVTPRIVFLSIYFSFCSRNNWWIQFVSVMFACFVYWFANRLTNIWRGATNRDTITILCFEPGSRCHPQKPEVDSAYRKLKQIGYLTSIITPSIVLNPWCDFYIRASFTSMLSYLTLMACLLLERPTVKHGTETIHPYLSVVFIVIFPLSSLISLAGVTILT